MLYASDHKFSKSFVGDFTFDIQRHWTRYPLFLNRNIMRVLDHHAKRSRPGARSLPETRSNGASGRTSQLALVTPPPRSTRLRDQLNEKFHQEDAELIFDVRSIRRKLNYRQNLEERPRKRVKREAVDCRCYFAVWDNRESHRQLEPILKRSEDCTVTPADTASDAHAVEIELENPFRIPAREFFVPIVKDGEVTKWAIGDRYLLEIKIIPCNTTELWPPMPILSKSEESLARGLVKPKDLAFTDGMLISNYTNLPHAPPLGVPLNVAFDQGGRTFKTKYGLEVNAEWTYPHVYEAKLKKEGEILVERMKQGERTDPLCRSIDRGRVAEQRESALSSIRENLPAKASVKISYIWDIETRTPVPKEARTISLEGFHCPVCHTHEYANLKRLQFHLSSNHDKYKFTVESQEQDLPSQKLKCVVFRVEVAEIVRPRATNHAKDEREFSWQRPERPFDIDAYLDGEQGWVGALPRRRTAAAAAGQPQPPQVSTSSVSAQVWVGVGRKNIFRPATEVSEIPLRTRKKFQVPVAKTRKRTSFYRSINHRTIETGDVLSETDDDVDDNWLIKRHHDIVAETDELTEPEKNFRQKWNAHIMSEGCPSPRYVSDSLIRFVRCNSACLRGEDGDPDMFILFQELTSMLMERYLIDTKVLKDCLRIIRDGGIDKNHTSELMADQTGGLLNGATAAGAAPEISKEVQNPSLHGPPPHCSGASAKAQGEDFLGANTTSLQPLIETDHPEASSRAQETATSIPEPGSQPGILQQPPISPEVKRVQDGVANGFCRVCKKSINRPKRNAITCSRLVSPVISPLYVYFYTPLSVQPLRAGVCEPYHNQNIPCYSFLLSLFFKVGTDNRPSQFPTQSRIPFASPKLLPAPVPSSSFQISNATADLKPQINRHATTEVSSATSPASD
jgi:VEFS-Box of polycomb protein